jgi:hypothetical protein
MTVFAGDPVLAEDYNRLLPLVAIKTIDEAAPLSSAAVQDDDELFIVVEANTRYSVAGWFRYTVTGGGAPANASTADFRLGYSAPSGATFTRTDWGVTSATTTAADSIDTLVVAAIGTDSGRGGGTSERSVYMQGDLIVGANAGTFRVRFGQVTSSGTETTTMKAGSKIELRRYLS